MNIFTIRIAYRTSKAYLPYKPDRKRQISYDIAYIWNLTKTNKKDTNEFIYKTEIDPQT